MISDKPLVSVIMPVYNAEKYIREAIESILNQTFTDFEFIIIDDCSTDNSLKIIQSYTDKRIKLHHNEANEGLVLTLNKGIDLAIGKYIARMDNDDISLPNRFEKQVAFLEQNPEFAIVGTSAIIIDSGGHYMRLADMYSNPDTLNTNLFFANNFIHPSIIGKTEVFKEIKYTPAYYFAEDYFLWSEIAHKHKVANLPEALVYYRIHDESMSIRNYIKQEICVKNIFSFHLKRLELSICSEEQLERHYLMLREKLDSNQRNWHEQLEILNWIKLLRTQNKKLNVYNQSYFNIKLSSYWNKYSQNSYRIGIKAIPLIFDPFNKGKNWGWKLWYIYKSIRKEAKRRISGIK